VDSPEALQSDTPIHDAIVEASKQNRYSFQTPGHTTGRGMVPQFRNYIGKTALTMDVSCCGAIDSLVSPRSFIKKGHELLAAAYGTLHSHYLVNGSSSGIHAMFLGTLEPGDKVILPRNVHLSVINALLLARVEPAWLYPIPFGKTHIVHNIRPEQVEHALREHPDAKAVFVSSPTYNGIVCNLRAIAQATHQAGKFLMVDEAWGAHLRFHPDFPTTAVDHADVCVQSLHKTLPVMNQGAVLHVMSERVSASRIEKALGVTLTTSPSYLLLANMDLARSEMALRGCEIFGELIALAATTRRRINAIKHLHCLGPDDLPPPFQLDPIKVTIDLSQLSLNGYQAERILLKHFGVQIEAAHEDHIIVLIKPGVDEEAISRLVDGLADLSRCFRQRREVAMWDIPPMHDRTAYDLNSAFFAKTTTVAFADALERVCGETICLYPPGVPLIFPGEKIGPEMHAYLARMRAMKANLQGSHQNLNQIQVIDEDLASSGGSEALTRSMGKSRS
jgi:arginine decarboxylase